MTLYGGIPFLVMLTSPLTWMVGLFGLVLGSFLNVCIYRIPEGKFWSAVRSQCRHCGALVPLSLNIPVVSFLYLRARTRCCHKPLAWQYPLVELATALMFVVIYWRLPFVRPFHEPWVVDLAQAWRFAHAALFGSLLLVCSVIDMRLRIIPDKISLPMIAATPLVVWLHPDLDWHSALFGVLAGGGCIYAIAWVYVLVRKREGIGMGDVKLLAAIGGWLGYQGVLPTLFYGSLLGSLYGIGALLLTRRLSLQAEVAFGPFLALGAMIHLLGGLHAYELFLFS